MPFDIVITFEQPVTQERFFEACRRAFPGCEYGDMTRNSPETNPVWDQMPEILKAAAIAMPDQFAMSCERPDGTIDLIGSKPEPIDEVLGELRGRYPWIKELTAFCRELGGVAIASMNRSVYAPTKDA